MQTVKRSPLDLRTGRAWEVVVFGRIVLERRSAISVHSALQAIFLGRQSQASRSKLGPSERMVDEKKNMTDLGTNNFPFAFFPILVSLSQRIDVFTLPYSKLLSQALVAHL